MKRNTSVRMNNFYKYIIGLSAILLLHSPNVSAQDILFQEDFETSPVTSITNTGYGDMPDGSSPCGKASRGLASDFNSTNVDFQGAENGTYFLGVNPESPCGGYYEAYLDGPTLDMSGLSDPYFKCRYFIGDGLNYGYTGISIQLNNGTNVHQLYAEFTERNTWTDFEIALPAEMISPSVEIILYMGGGDGVGLDDFTIQDGPTVPCEETSSNETMAVCESYDWNGITYTTSGIFQEVFTNSAGCDSTATLDLTILEPSSFTFSETACEAYDFNGTTLTASGVYEDVLVNSMGCDSLVTLNLTIDPLNPTCVTITHVDDLEFEEIQIGPNPTPGDFTIQLSRGVRDLNVQVFNIQGELVFSHDYEVTDIINSRIEGPSGVYLVRITGSDINTQTIRMIKE